jgi:hypothetical protein
MSFGLLTAITIEDVPKIMRNIAETYRTSKRSSHQDEWKRIADLLDEYASDVSVIIKKAQSRTKAKRERWDD